MVSTHVDYTDLYMPEYWLCSPCWQKHQPTSRYYQLMEFLEVLSATLNVLQSIPTIHTVIIYTN